MGEDKIRKAIHVRLQRGSFPNKYGHSSAFIGLPGRAILVALAAREDIVFRKVFGSLFRVWEQSNKETPYGDLMLGAAGALLACAEIETLLPGVVPQRLVKSLQMRTLQATRSELGKLSRGENIYLGLAHGLAGYLLALEAAQTVFGKTLTSSFRAKLIEEIGVMRLECPGGAALWTVWSNSDAPSFQGWCHGSPGIGLALLAGFSMTGRQEYWQLAHMALKGASIYSSGSRTFCCGAIGKTQIFIEAYRITKDKRWLKDATTTVTGDKYGRWHNPRRRGFHDGRLGEFYLKERFSNHTLPLLGLGPLSVPS